MLIETELQLRWQSFLDEPRFVMSEDFAAWSRVVVALQPGPDENNFLAMLFRMGSSQQATAWAACRTTKRIFRFPALALSALPTPITAPAARAKPARATVSDWADPAVWSVWETHLADPARFELSLCSRPFNRVQEDGDFATVGVSLADDRVGEITRLLNQVPAIDARPLRERQRFEARLKRRERQLARRAMQCIETRLDPAIIHTMRSGGLRDGLTAHRINWLASSQTDVLRTRRVQALVAAPLLLPMLLRTEPHTTDSGTGKGTGTDRVVLPTLDEVIEQGAPLYAALAQRAGLTERTVRHLRTASLREHHLSACFELNSVPPRIQMLSWLDVIPVEQWPRTLPQWKLWVQVCASLSRQCRLIDALVKERRMGDELSADVGAGTGDFEANANASQAAIAHRFYRELAASGWTLKLKQRDAQEWLGVGEQLSMLSFELRDLLEQLRTGGRDEADRWAEDYAFGDGAGDGDGDGDEVDGAAAAAVVDVIDVAEADAEDGTTVDDAVTVFAFYPPGDRTRATDIPEQPYQLPEAVRRELRGWSIRQWWEASDRWHQSLAEARVQRGVEDSRYSNPGETLHWIPLAEPFCDSGGEGRTIRFLMSSEALIEEGTAMKHCVRIRIDDCLVRRVHIASVMDAEGRRRSTLALRLDYVDGRWRPVVSEHRALTNRAPDPASERAVQALLVSLGRDALQVHFQHIENARRERQVTLRARLPDRRNETLVLRQLAMEAALPAHVLAMMQETEE